jgi:hypothetical protein
MRKPHAILGSYGLELCVVTMAAGPGAGLFCPRLSEVCRMENPILQETELGEYLSYVVGGVCVFGLRLGGRTQYVPPPKHKPDATNSWGIPLYRYRINIRYSPDWILASYFV